MKITKFEPWQRIGVDERGFPIVAGPWIKYLYLPELPWKTDVALLVELEWDTPDEADFYNGKVACYSLPSGTAGQVVGSAPISVDLTKKTGWGRAKLSLSLQAGTYWFAVRIGSTEATWGFRVGKDEDPSELQK